MGAQDGGVVTLRDVELHDWAGEVVEVNEANERASPFLTALDPVISTSASAAGSAMSTSTDSWMTTAGLLTSDSAIVNVIDSESAGSEGSHNPARQRFGERFFFNCKLKFLRHVNVPCTHEVLASASPLEIGNSHSPLLEPSFISLDLTHPCWHGISTHGADWQATLWPTSRVEDRHCLCWIRGNAAGGGGGGDGGIDTPTIWC